MKTFLAKTPKIEKVIVVTAIAVAVVLFAVQFL